MFEDQTLQIFLTAYHGSLLATFVYDYVIRNSVRLFYQGLHWPILVNIILGVLFIAVIVWAIMSVWHKIKRNLLISFVVLIIIFIIRLGVGVPELMSKSSDPKYSRGQYMEELVVFAVQVVIHLLGIIATFLLANNS
jgi:hypothetical protein